MQPQSVCRKAATCLAAAVLIVAVAACAGPKRPRPAPVGAAPTAGPAGPPPHVTSCRDYADQMAGRELQREYDVMSGNFRGGDSRVFQDFARMDAQKYYRQLYESCLSQQRARNNQVK